jgi:Xaa-Pro aminopeptidase
MWRRQQRALQIAAAEGADALAVAGPPLVTWLTGFAPEIEIGPSVFQLSAFAVLAPGAAPVLVVSEDEVGDAAKTGCEVAAYPGFGIDPIDPIGHAAAALMEVVDGRRTAIDAGFFPAALARGIDWVDAGDRLAAAKAVKDPDEIERIRAAIAVCDAGQAAARETAAPGMTELDLWAHVRAAMERAAGGRIPVMADCVSGPRTCDVGGPPSTRTMREGDLVLIDLVPRVAGYWGDSCSTFALGEPPAAVREAHARAHETLDGVKAAIRPGAVARDLDGKARAKLQYPHHTGHGLGTAWHEEPRLVPRSPTVLEEGMVVAIEPGTYDVGLRVEHVVLVTADGCETLSRHDIEL